METLHKALEYYFGIGIEAFTGRLTIEKNDKGEAVKRPFLPKWKDAQFTLESALDLLSANDNCVCLKTGRKSGLWVLDIDNHGAAGVDTLREIGVNIDGAPCEKTQSGGTHVFYAFPADFVGSGTTAKPAAGLDARGEGGLIFAAPTKVNGGGEYAIVKPILRDRSNLSEPPKALLDFLFPPKQTTAPVPAAPRARRTGPLTPKQHAWWESALRECAAETEDRSKADFALLCTAVKLGMHPENVFRDCATIGKFRERGRLYFDTTWGRAAAAVPPSAPKRSAGPTRPQIVASATSADVQSIRSELWEISQTEGMTGTEKNRASAVAVVKWLHARSILPYQRSNLCGYDVL